VLEPHNGFVYMWKVCAVRFPHIDKQTRLRDENQLYPLAAEFHFQYVTWRKMRFMRFSLYHTPKASAGRRYQTQIEQTHYRQNKGQYG